VGTALAALALPAQALAHVTVSPTRAAPGSLALLTFTVENELAAGASRLDRVRIDVPAGVRVATAEAKPGWTARRGDRFVEWSGGSIDYREFDTFALTARLPPRSAPVVFRTTERFAAPAGGVQEYPTVLVVGAAPATAGGEDTELARVALVAALAAGGLALLAFAFGLARWLRG
jgi:hypothetical protein